MKITVHGTRGSYPICSSEVIRYGGNTTCMIVENKNDKLIIDGGSGIAKVGAMFMHKKTTHNNINILFTHHHWDHVMGIPFFAPLYSSEFSITIHGADSETMMLEEIFSRHHGGLNFPVTFESLKADINFNKINPNDLFSFESINVKTYQLNHPGIDLGYRFESESGVFVFLTDLAPIEDNYLGIGMTEKGKDNPKGFEQEYYNGLVEFIKGADIVMHDTNFTDEEIKDKKHWGHSSPLDALKLLSHIDSPPALILSHHDPNHSDIIMDTIYQEARSLGKKMKIDVFIAKEGGQFSL